MGAVNRGKHANNRFNGLALNFIVGVNVIRQAVHIFKTIHCTVINIICMVLNPKTRSIKDLGKIVVNQMLTAFAKV